MSIKDRVVELKRVKGRDLAPNPLNWRHHPDEQKAAMKGLLAEVGWSDVAIAYESDQGLMLIDGHLRAEIAPDDEIPVIVLDVNEEEARKILATHDVVTTLAGVKQEDLAFLVKELELESQAVGDMLLEYAKEHDADPFGGLELDPDPPSPPEAVQLAVLVLCESEEHQDEVADSIKGLGLTAKKVKA